MDDDPTVRLEGDAYGEGDERRAAPARWRGAVAQTSHSGLRNPKESAQISGGRRTKF
jgi:hypothetical protein